MIAPYKGYGKTLIRANNAGKWTQTRGDRSRTR
jgi:hypothetical protein